MSHLEDLPAQPEVPTPSDDPVVLQDPSLVPEGFPRSHELP